MPAEPALSGSAPEALTSNPRQSPHAFACRSTPAALVHTDHSQQDQAPRVYIPWVGGLAVHQVEASPFGAYGESSTSRSVQYAV
jgi:hypothetical protein